MSDAGWYDREGIDFAKVTYREKSGYVTQAYIDVKTGNGKTSTPVNQSMSSGHMRKISGFVLMTSTGRWMSAQASGFLRCPKAGPRPNQSRS